MALNISMPDRVPVFLTSQHPLYEHAQACENETTSASNDDSAGQARKVVS